MRGRNFPCKVYDIAYDSHMVYFLNYLIFTFYILSFEMVSLFPKDNLVEKTKVNLENYTNIKYEKARL